MKFLLPKTLTGQMVAMMVIVLIIAQLANLYVIGGYRAVTDRSKETGHMAKNMVELAAEYRTEPKRKLPQILAEGPSWGGIFFLAKDNQVQFNKGRKRDDVEAALKTKLREAGKTVLNISAVSAKLQPPDSGPSDRKALPVTEGRDLAFPGSKPPALGGLPPPPAGTGKRPVLDPDTELVIMSVELESGIWLNAMIPYRPTQIASGQMAIVTLILAILGAIAIWLLARRIARPLSELTLATDDFGRGGTLAPMTSSGPDDVKAAAYAFNQMQIRLVRQLETQRSMLRAVGHDLRSPLTSLRVRAEAIPAEYGRDKIIGTLDEMKEMLEEILNWAKDAYGTEEQADVDLGAMIQSISDDYADFGEKVEFSELDHPVTVSCRRAALKRAIRNLIDNALRYAGSAALSVKQVEDKIVIEVNDDGPGIAEDQQEAVLRPFYRIESSRSKNTGGVGLGLSIVQSVAEAHGGTLQLCNKTTGGLSAKISIPMAVSESPNR